MRGGRQAMHESQPVPRVFGMHDDGTRAGQRLAGKVEEQMVGTGLQAGFAVVAAIGFGQARQGGLHAGADGGGALSGRLV